jgi:hypothetical protein
VSESRREDCAETRDRQVFDVDGVQISATSSGDGQRVLAEAHSHRTRPACLCVDGGVPMYIARVGDRFIVKRMPHTGMVHATDCPSYLPPETLSGLGQVLGGAIIEQADTGITALRLGFRMAKADRNGPTPASSGDGGSDSVTADGTRLGMRAVLHYLWQEADLVTWSPAMAGKRNWRVVSWYLRQAARGKFTRGKPLAGRLFVPEPFSADHKADLASWRISAWAPARAKGRFSQFMILIGEVKTIEPVRFGHKLVIKHLPDAPLMLDDDLHRRMLKRFADELELWQADAEGHLMVIATFTVGHTGLASVQELSLAMTDKHWLPYESAADKLLLDSAITARRRFTKSLRYNLSSATPMASLVFTDTDVPTAAYLLDDVDDREDIDTLHQNTGTDIWTWVVGEPMPPLPEPRSAATERAART